MSKKEEVMTLSKEEQGWLKAAEGLTRLRLQRLKLPKGKKEEVIEERVKEVRRLLQDCLSGFDILADPEQVLRMACSIIPEKGKKTLMEDDKLKRSLEVALRTKAAKKDVKRLFKDTDDFDEEDLLRELMEHLGVEASGPEEEVLRGIYELVKDLESGKDYLLGLMDRLFVNAKIEGMRMILLEKALRELKKKKI